MKTLSSFLMTTLLSSILAAGPALASDPSDEVKAPGQPFEHPSDSVSYSKDAKEDKQLADATSTDNGEVKYISGGIGDSGMKAIDEEERDYNLKMLFVAEPSGEYLANIGVKIKDHKGKTVLNTTAKGPVLLVRMPHGHYTVDATRETGAKLTQKVEAGEDHLSSYVLRYPETKSN